MAGGSSDGAPRPAPVLMLAYYFPPENRIGALRPARFVRGLRALGHDVRVLAATTTAAGEPDPQVERLPSHQPTPRLVAALSRLFALVQRVLLPFDDRLAWVPHAAQRAIAHLRANPGAVMVSSFPPVAVHLAALAAKRGTGAQWIADFRDPLRGNPTRLGRRAVVLDWLLKRTIMAHADAVIANTDAAGALLRARYPAHAHKVQVIWNGMDPDFQPGTVPQPAPAPTPAFRCIAHVGSLYAARSPEKLIASLERLLESGALAQGSVELRLVGPVEANAAPPLQGGTGRLRAAGALHLVDTLLPRAAAKAEMQRADILLLLELAPDSAQPLQLPAKIFEYLETGRPIMAFTQAGSPTATILRRAGTTHMLIDPRWPDAEIDQAVLAMLRANPAPCSPSPTFLREFNATTQTEALARLIDDLAGRRGPHSATEAGAAAR